MVKEANLNMYQYYGLLVWILASLHGVEGYEQCNRTYRSQDYKDPDEDLVIHMKVDARDVRKSIQCWINFEGRPNEIVQVRVRGVRTGTYDKKLGTCVQGHLRIYDGLTFNVSSFSPTVLCGYYDIDGPVSKRINVKRLTSQSSAKVDFFILRAHSNSGFDIEVRFYEKNEKTGLKQYYGNYHITRGRIPGTKCDWIIPAQNCLSYCYFVSPGFPGVYPPNTSCRYYLNNVDGKRIRLYTAQTSRVKFDMKESPDCREDYINVYDGNSTSSSLIGRYCGQDGQVMVSKTDSLLVEFVSGRGGPEYDYSGFEAAVEDHWADTAEGGKKVPGTICDWIFNQSGAGDIFTADHILPQNTVCKYEFKGSPHERIIFSVVITRMSFKCLDYIEIEADISKGSKLKKICMENLDRPGKRNEFKFTTTGPIATIRYVHRGGQISNKDPIFIDYSFVSGEVSGADQAAFSIATLLIWTTIAVLI